MLYLSAYMPTRSVLTANGLVKHNLAELLLAEIMNGSLQPGMRIVEGAWARKFGVAQGSIREAINILTQDGFVTKEPGRSARVIHLSKLDVAQLYELRGAIEGLAAKLAAVVQADLSPLQSAIQGMREAAHRKNPEDILNHDLQFHLELCRASANPYLVDHGRKILLPFFAFARMRIMASKQEASIWNKDLEAHQRIVDLLREGEGEVAEQYVKKAMARFARTSYDNWEKRAFNGK
jgi:DNA-binding GntR family transcriptional regulator